MTRNGAQLMLAVAVSVILAGGDLSACGSATPSGYGAGVWTPTPLDSTPPRLLSNNQAVPTYPAALRTVGVTGTVVVKLAITKAGRVDTSSSTIISSTNGAFARDLLGTVAAWHFKPARSRGRPVPSSLTVTISFQIDNCKKIDTGVRANWAVDSVAPTAFVRVCKLPFGWSPHPTSPPAAPFASYIRTIRAISDSLGLPDLAHGVASGRMEVRVWSGFGLTGIWLVRAVQDGAHWITTEISNPLRVATASFRPWISESCWRQRWTKDVAKAFFALPASPVRPPSYMYPVNDGSAIFMEVVDGPRYHIAGADNPTIHNSKDDQRLLRIMKAIFPPNGDSCAAP